MYIVWLVKKVVGTLGTEFCDASLGMGKCVTFFY